MNDSPTTPRDWARWLTESARDGSPSLSVDQSRRLALVLEGLVATVAQLETECHRLQERRPSPSWSRRGDAMSDYRESETAVTPAESDPVEHPSHYTRGTVECIDAIEAAVTGLEGVEAVLTGQTLKYLWRWRHKGSPLEDLKKARWYLDRLLARAGGGAPAKSVTDPAPESTR